MDLAAPQPRRHGVGAWTEAFLLAAPALLVALIAVPFRYELTLSEPDLVRMMAALVYGTVSGAGEAAGMHYGLPFSFGYYKLVYALAPEHWLRDPDSAARVMNALGVAAGMSCALACSVFLRSLFGLAAGVAATALFFLSPATLPLALSGHPLVPATACLFFAGWCLVTGDDATALRRTALWSVGAGVLAIGLSLRAEIVLAFPFLWLATRPGQAWRTHAAKAALLAGAFALFLVAQMPYASADGGALASLGSFLQSFASPTRMARGIVILVLATGIATLGLAFVIVLRGLRREPLLLPAALALPALALWLPNPQPARHFLFVVLACGLVVVLWLRERLAPAPLLAACLGIAAANQLLAELVRPAIVARYAWSYPAASERRATQQVPLGAFPLDQRANQAAAALERCEAIELARQAPRRLVILADFQHSIAAHLISADRALRWRDLDWGGGGATELRSADRHYVLIERYRVWPRELVPAVLDEPRWRDWPVYVQPTTVSRFDRTPIPRERRFALPRAVCDRS